jgi:putative aldouronate transport system substrate-binding protein
MTKIQEAGISAHPAGGSMTTGTSGMDQNYAYRDYPTDEEEWAMYGDYAIPSLGWEPNKKLLQRANEDYNLGFTDPDYYTIDSATAEANFINGLTYSYSAYISADMPVLTSFYENNPDAKLAIGIQNNVADEEGGTVPAFRSNNPFGMMIGFSSMATDDEIKAAMMYMEWMTQEDNLFTFQWGIEGENYTVGDDGLPVSVADYSGEYTQGFNNNKDYWCVTIEARNAGTIEDMIKASSPQGLPQDFTDDLIENYYNQVAAWEKGWVPTDCMFATDIASVSEYQGTLLSLYAELRDKLVMCDPSEFDALYEECAQKYADAGYAEIAAERLEALQNGLSSRME